MKFGLEAKVGIFVVLSLLLIGYMTTKVGDISFGPEKGVTVTAYLANASGLQKDSIVKFKGVEVGKIKDIKLEDSRVAVDILLYKGASIPANIRAVVRQEGFLGEKFLELELKGSESASTLESGAVITDTKEYYEMDQLTSKLVAISDDISILVKSLNEVFASQAGKENLSKTIENVRYSTESLRAILAENEKKINRIVQNVEEITASINKITISNQENVNELIANLTEVSMVLKSQTPGIAEKVSNITGNIDEFVAGSKDDLAETVKNMKTVTAKLEKSVDNINEITDKINKGDGTVSTLINDNETAQDLKDAVKGVKKMVTAYDRFKIYLSFSGERNLETDENKGYFKVKIQPRENKYYLLGIASTEDGREYVTTTRHSFSGDVPYYVDGGAGTGSQTYTEKETKRKEDSLTFIAQYAQRFFNKVDLRIGIMESAVGVGADYYPFENDKLQVSFDAFDFSDSYYDPHLKASLQYNITKNLFLNVGYDDFLNKETRGAFIGGGIIFLDDDIKYLLGRIPVPSN
jgi:phospholipid/cholesterol/gamma-HCH transport system substrate-binding protein